MGTYDAAWLEERAPLLPLDHDDRTNLCATPGLTATPPLAGGEPVALTHLTPGGGAVAFRLPRIGVSVTLAVRPEHGASATGREPRPRRTEAPALDTVLIDTLSVPEGAVAVVELVWRAVFPHPKRLKDAVITVTEEEVAP